MRTCRSGRVQASRQAAARAIQGKAPDAGDGWRSYVCMYRINNGCCLQGILFMDSSSAPTRTNDELSKADAQLTPSLHSCWDSCLYWHPLSLWALEHTCRAITSDPFIHTEIYACHLVLLPACLGGKRLDPTDWKLQDQWKNRAGAVALKGAKRVPLQIERDGGESFLGTADTSAKQQPRTDACALKRTRWKHTSGG